MESSMEGEGEWERGRVAERERHSVKGLQWHCANPNDFPYGRDHVTYSFVIVELMFFNLKKIVLGIWDVLL